MGATKTDVAIGEEDGVKSEDHICSVCQKVSLIIIQGLFKNLHIFLK